MFIVALFKIGKRWEQHKCPFNAQKKMWSTHTMEDCAAIKRNECLSFLTTRMELKTIILSKISQAQKHKNHMILLRRKL